MKKILWLVLCSMMVTYTKAQHAVISRSSVEERMKILGDLPRDPMKVEAESFARQFGIPDREVDPSGKIREIWRIQPNRRPLFMCTHNIDAARTVSTYEVWNGGIDGLDLRGSNILVAVWDGGRIRTTHVEFGTRAYTFDSGYDVVGHATHVAGTIGATGLEPDATGMANLCLIEGYDWHNDNIEMREAAEDGLLISNHSYGFIQGFDYNSSERRWEWFGDIDIDEKEDYKFGFYGTDARIWDDIAYDNPYYTIVKSAGNDRLEGPASGGIHYVWDNGWKESNAVRDKDGGPGGFDCIGTQSTSKNIMSVGAVRDIAKGYEVPGDVEMTDFSVFGPTDDGRIKPDIVGNGASLYSTYYNNDNDYDHSSGTSMSAANVAGSLALLQELHYTSFNSYLKSSTLKGLVLHTADDAGNPGPDYRFGWGLLNTFKAAQFISDDQKIILEDSITDHSKNDYRFYAPGDSAVRITICWTDPQGPILLPSLDPQDLVLVNDLDIRLINLNDSSIYEPYILIPETPNEPAVKGDNFRDNVEQIYIPVLENGYFDLVITHKDTLVDAVQHYSLIIDGIQQVFVAEDSTYLDNNNGYLLVTDAPEYPLDKRFVWLVEPQNQQPVSLHFTEFSTDVNDFVTIYDGRDATAPVLASFSGTLINPDTLITSTSGSLFLEFSTGTETGFKGFSSRYCTTPPEETIEILGKENPCHFTTELYYFVELPETDYQWILSGNIEDSATVDQNSVDLQIPADPFLLGVTPSNRCGSGIITERTIEPLTTPPVIDQVMEGDTIPCTNAPSLFRVEEDSSVTYEWILPGGWEGASDSASIWITPEKEAGTITVIPSNSCGTSEGISLSVDPMSLPRVPVIESDRISPCENSEQLFYILAEEEVDYSWEVEPGWEIIGPDTLSSVLVEIGDGAAGRMFLSASNRCGDTLTSRNFLLSLSPNPPVLIRQPSIYGDLKEIVIRDYSDYAQVRWYRNDSLIQDFDEEYLVLQRNGTYRVEVANSQGCWASTPESNWIQMNEETLVYNISTGSEGIIKIENDSNAPALMQVFDLTGRMVSSEEIQQGTTLFNTHRRGLLIFRIEGRSHLKTQMIFVH